MSGVIRFVRWVGRKATPLAFRRAVFGPLIDSWYKKWRILIPYSFLKLPVVHRIYCLLYRNRWEAQVRAVLGDRKPHRLRAAKAVVIAVTAFEPSMKVAKRCVESAAKFGTEVEIYPAYTPKDNPLKMMHTKGFVAKERETRHHPLEPAAGLFMTNFEIWQRCVDENRPYLILEHDAIFTAPLPDTEVRMVLNLGHPKFDGFYFVMPPGRGLRELESEHLRGSHAYAIHPKEAQRAMELAPQHWTYLDQYFSKKRFPIIETYLPYVIFTGDDFSMTNPTNPES